MAQGRRAAAQAPALPPASSGRPAYALSQSHRRPGSHEACHWEGGVAAGWGTLAVQDRRAAKTTNLWRSGAGRLTARAMAQSTASARNSALSGALSTTYRASAATASLQSGLTLHRPTAVGNATSLCSVPKSSVWTTAVAVTVDASGVAAMQTPESGLGKGDDGCPHGCGTAQRLARMGS